MKIRSENTTCRCKNCGKYINMVMFYNITESLFQKTVLLCDNCYYICTLHDYRDPSSLNNITTIYNSHDLGAHIIDLINSLVKNNAEHI